MNYTVVWLPTAERELARIWLLLDSSASKDQVTRAAHQIEHTLANSPGSSGDEFYGDLLLRAAPLCGLHHLTR